MQSCRKKAAIKSGLACLILVASLVIAGLANAAPPDTPDAGRTLSDLRRSELTVPDKPLDKIETQQVYRPPLRTQNGSRITVVRFRITGQELYPEGELLALIAERQGKELTLADLEEAAAVITQYFRKNGYMLAQAYIPAQEIRDGVVEINIITGQYDRIIIHNHSRVAERILLRELGSVRSGAYIHQKLLERAVYLLGDLAGVDAKATLMPGRRAGTSDLILDISPRDKVLTGNFELNNYGNRFTGSYQSNLRVSINNPFASGDIFTVYGTKANTGLDSGSISFNTPGFAQGHKLGIHYSKLNYQLGEDFAFLNARGTADTLSISWDIPIIRSRLQNTGLQISYGNKRLLDLIDGMPDKHKTANTWSFSLSGDSVDRWGGGGAIAYFVGYTTGRLYTDDADDQITAKTAGSYAKWNISAVRRQHVAKRLALLTTLSVQWAGNNLDSAEKFSLGGAHGVRAYPSGEASGDEGYLLTGELRWEIPLPKNAQDNFQLIGFVDTGYIKINKELWPGYFGANSRRLTGIGFGVSWNKAGDYAFQVNYSWKAGAEQAISDTDKSGRLWVQGITSF